jgi:hypothetical protein
MKCAAQDADSLHQIERFVRFRANRLPADGGETRGSAVTDGGPKALVLHWDRRRNVPLAEPRMRDPIPSIADEADLPQLVARAKAGETTALDALCRRCYDDILRQFQMWLPSEAEDLTQKLFMDLPRKLAGYEESGRFRAWLRAVAYNHFRTARRSEIRPDSSSTPKPSSRVHRPT